MLTEQGDGRTVASKTLSVVYVGDSQRGTALGEELSSAAVVTESRGTDALATLESRHADCVVAEADLGDATGPRLLEAVGELYPDTARVLLGSSVADAPADVAFVPTRPRAGLPARTARRIRSAVERRTVERERDLFVDRLRTMVGESPDPIITIDEDCNVVFANEATERVFGRDPSSVVGESVCTMLAERVHDEFCTSIRELVDDEGLVRRDYVEVPGRRSDGREIPLAISFRETVRDGTHYFSGIVRDVSERKRLEDRLEAEKRKTRELHEVAVMLEERDTPEEVCRLAVETAENLLEFDLCAVDIVEDGELVPKAVSKGVPSDGYYTTTPLDADDNLAARAYREDRSLCTSDLHQEDVDPAASGYRAALTVPMSGIGVFQAVSQDRDAFGENDRELTELLVAHVAQALKRIRSERALEDERDRFAALFENTRDAIINYEERDGDHYFRSVNDAFEEVFGYDAESIVGEPILDTIVPDDRRDGAREHIDQMRRGEHVDSEVRRKTDDGLRDFLLRTAGIPGDSSGYVIYTDITDRKRLERNLERQKRKVEQLHHVAVTLEGCDTAAEVYEQTVDAAEEILEFDICGVAIEEDDYLVPKATTSEFDEHDYEILRVDEGIAGRTFRNRESYVIEDVDDVSDGRIVNEDLRSFLSVPIGDEGVLQAGSRVTGGFDGDDARLAELLVTHAYEALQRVRSEQALRAERDRFAALFENVPEPTVDYELRDGDPVVRSVNEAFEEVFGYAADEAVGESLDDLIVPDEAVSEARRLNDRVRTGERVDAEVRRVAADGVRDFLLRNAEVSESAGNYVIYTDITERKEREEMLDALHGATRDLMAAGTQRDIGETAVETSREVLDIPHAVVFRWDDDREQLRPYVVPDDTVDAIGDPPTFERGEGLVGHVFESGEAVHFDNAWDDPRAHEDGSEGIRAFAAFPLGEWGVMTIASPSVGAFDEYEIDLVRVLAANTEVALNRAAREEELADQRSQLAELDRINEVIRDVDQLLVEATTREEIAQSVCDRLVDSPHYRFAWLDPQASPGKGPRPAVSAGVDDGYLDYAMETYDETPDGPPEEAFQTGEVQVVEDVGEDPDFEPWREEALERGYRSEIAVPLRYRDTVYGVLCIYANRPNAFDERERAVIAELGETIGHAINAVENKKALLSDGVVEIEFDIYGGDGFFSRVPREEGGRFSLEGVTITAEGSFVYFMTVSGIDPDRVRERAEAADDVERARLVNEHDDGHLFEFVYIGPSPLPALADRGGTLREATFTPDGGHSVIELPRNANVRSVIESIQDVLPETEILAQRERERPERTVEEFRTALDDDLTDRQRSALEAAFYAGFFEWPRESNGEEVSESLGVSAPTFHQHLRVGERKLLSAFLGE